MQKRWNILPLPPASFYEEHPELPAIAATLLYHRGLTTQAQIDEFLSPDYSKDVHDPFLFKDMRLAVDRIYQAIERQELITIHGDYDADGVSGCVILKTFFDAVGYSNVDVFLPHRDTDGYGLNKKNVHLLAEKNTKLIISCDCGISNKPEVELARELGVDVIITDHHSIPDELPPAYATIHPKIEQETYPDKNLAGGAVAFKLVQGLLQEHKKTNETLPDGERHEAFEKWLLDMVALSSVADMVPLIGESRTLTKYGLIVLNKTRRIGMKKLLMEIGLMDMEGELKRELDAHTIG
ncbi:MAG: single-stranded-DNA-specific exonuclease RecJ, partial [Candidatus Magasanikbacteria bacterium CG10_big_fil_rev_8_21_14_0_10_43_6]